MILGMSFELFTQIHVALSLAGLAAGVVALGAHIGDRAAPGWSAAFLATTALSVATGFAFPTGAVTPAQIVGAITTATLAVALHARYLAGWAGRWRAAYAIAATASLYLNSFVAVVQSFQKLAPLRALAPTQTEAPFVAAQLLLLAAFVAAGWLTVARFHPARPLHTETLA